MNNFSNKLITKNEVEKILKKYNVHNLLWYQRAFACQCYYEQLLSENSPLTQKNQIFEKSNETLEIVGDSILGQIVVEYLEERFPEEREGFLSLLKMHITKTDGLYMLAQELEFSKYILLSNESETLQIRVDKKEELVKGRENPEFLENCFEAFVGALFLDYKYKYNPGEAYTVCRNFIIDLFETYLDFSELILRNDNYKNILQHYFHTRKWPLPTYSDLHVEIDTQEKRIYTRGIYLERFLLYENEIQNLLLKKKYKNIPLIQGSKILIGVGTSYKKKNADQLCAKDVLTFFCPETLELDLEIVEN